MKIVNCVQKILVPHAGTLAGDKALKHAVHVAKSDTESAYDIIYSNYVWCL